MAISGLKSTSRIFDGFTHGFAVSVFIDFPVLREYYCVEFLRRVLVSQRGKRLSVKIGTPVGLRSKLAWISFFAFVEFLIHLNKFRG